MLQADNTMCRFTMATERGTSRQGNTRTGWQGDRLTGELVDRVKTDRGTGLQGNRLTGELADREKADRGTDWRGKD